MATPFLQDRHRTMRAMEERLRGKHGMAVCFQRNVTKPKSGVIRLVKVRKKDGRAVDALELSFPSLKKPKERIRCQDLAGLFGSTRSDLSAAIVLLGANRKWKNRGIRMTTWRFTMVAEIQGQDAVSLRDTLLQLLQHKGQVANGLLTNLVPTDALHMVDSCLGFFSDTFDEEGLVGDLNNCLPELVHMSQQLFQVGQSAAIVGPLFTLFAFAVEDYQGLQQLKSAFIGLLSRWGRVQVYLEDQDRLRHDLLALTEDFFCRPAWRQGLALTDFETNVNSFAEKLDRAVQDQTLHETRRNGQLAERHFEMTERQGDQLVDMHAKLDTIVGMLHHQNANWAGSTPPHQAFPDTTPQQATPSLCRRAQQQVDWPSRRESNHAFVPWTFGGGGADDDEKVPYTDTSGGDLEEGCSLDSGSTSDDDLEEDCSVDSSYLSCEGFDCEADSGDPTFLETESDESYSMETLMELHQALNCVETMTDTVQKRDAAKAVILRVDALREKDAVSRFSEPLQREELQQFARLLKRCGNVYRTVLSDDQSSQAFYEGALRAYQVAYGENGHHPSIAKAWFNLGAVNESRREYNKAKDHYLKALTVFQALYGEEARSDTASVLCCLGVVYEALKKYEKAREYNEQSLAMHRELGLEEGNLSKIAILLRNLGSVYRSLRDYTKAKEHYEEALAMHFAVYGDSASRLDTAKIYFNLGLTCRSLEDYAQSKEHFTKALKIYQAHGDANRLDTANTLYYVGRSCKSLEEYMEALDHFYEALTLYRVLYGESANRSSIAVILHYLGRIYELLQYDELARSHFMDALTMRRVLHGENNLHPEVKESLDDMERVGPYILCVDLK